MQISPEQRKARTASPQKAGVPLLVTLLMVHGPAAPACRELLGSILTHRITPGACTVRSLLQVTIRNQSNSCEDFSSTCD